jgi:hypothetical protein
VAHNAGVREGVKEANLRVAEFIKESAGTIHAASERVKKIRRLRIERSPRSRFERRDQQIVTMRNF